MKPPPLRLALTSWFVALAFLLMGGFAVMMFVSLEKALSDGQDARLEQRARALVDLCEWEAETGSVEFEAREAVFHAPDEEGFDVHVGPPLRLLHRAGTEIPGTPGLASTSVHRPQITSYMDLPGAPGRRICQICVRRRAEGTSASEPAREAFTVVVRVAEGRRTVEDALERTASRIAPFALLAGIAAVIFGFVLGHRFVRPLHRLAEAAARVGMGARTPMPTRGTGDEADRLSEVLEKTFDRLDESLLRQTRFTADAAHELRTPIAIIRNAADVALRRERSTSDYREFLRDILATSDRMGDTVEVLLMLARMDAGLDPQAFAAVDLGTIVNDVVETAAHEGAVMHFENTSSGRVRGNGPLLRVLVQNLVTNAIRHGAKTPIDITLSEVESMLVLSVRDHGPGIDPSSRERVFQRFDRGSTPPSHPQGAGLGLAIVWEVARIHDARCALEDAAPGVRATLRFQTFQDGDAE